MTRLRNAGRQVSGFARAVVAKRVLIVAAVGATLDWAVDAGLLPDTVSEQAQELTGKAILAVAVIGAVFWAQSGTTPADPALSPVSSNGLPLREHVVGERTEVSPEPTRLAETSVYRSDEPL